MLSIKPTLESGQIFRYYPEADGYRILYGQNSFFVKQAENNLEFTGISKSRFADFFRMDDDYSNILAQINKDENINDAITRFNGLRIIRQDPWECTVSFLCSMASNIPKIKQNLNNIAKTFGTKKEEFDLFPRIGEIDNLPKLKQCGVGFRAKYVYEVNNTITKSFINKVKKLKYEDAKQNLMEFPGIGPKVADCILLFSLEHLNSFPIDVWMERVMKEHYGHYLPKPTLKNMHAFVQDYFGDYAGYAQEFLYHWKRNTPTQEIFNANS